MLQLLTLFFINNLYKIRVDYVILSHVILVRYIASVLLCVAIDFLFFLESVASLLFGKLPRRGVASRGKFLCIASIHRALLLVVGYPHDAIGDTCS